MEQVLVLRQAPDAITRNIYFFRHHEKIKLKQMLGAWGKTDCLDGCPQVGLLLVLVLSLLISLLVHL